MQEMIWVTRRREHIPVHSMTTSHIINCIRLIEKSRFTWRNEYYERLKLELEIRSLGHSSRRL